VAKADRRRTLATPHPTDAARDRPRTRAAPHPSGAAPERRRTRATRSRDGDSSQPFQPERSSAEALYGHIFGYLAAHTALDHLNFKEDEASHEWEGSSSLKFR
jgi:hypothetical protein